MISANYLKNTYYAGAIISELLVFYTLEKNGTIHHLTFDKERHTKALRRLQETPEIIITMPPNHISTAEIVQLLSQKTPLQEIHNSSFFQQGSAFQKKVWNFIGQIPLGQQQTYGELAQKMGNKKLARAVGQACNANPLALLIPCHRVIGKSAIGGFAGGSEVKLQLLRLEKRAIRG